MTSGRPVTEFAILPLHKDNQNLSTSPDSQAAQLHASLAKTVLSQSGAQRLYWSTEVENPSNLRWFIDWESRAHHQKFQDADHYTPFVEQFRSLLDGDITLYHVAFEKHPPSVLGDPKTGATEVLACFFPADVSDSSRSEFGSRMQKLLDAIDKSAQPGQYTGSALGWAIEDDIPFPDGSGKGKAFVVLIGWQSVQAHMDFRGTQAFKDNIHLLLEAKDLATRKMVHVQCQVAEN